MMFLQVERLNRVGVTPLRKFLAIGRDPASVVDGDPVNLQPFRTFWPKVDVKMGMDSTDFGRHDKFADMTLASFAILLLIAGPLVVLLVDVVRIAGRTTHHAAAPAHARTTPAGPAARRRAPDAAGTVATGAIRPGVGMVYRAGSAGAQG
jgi:hypothetical protein